MRELASNAGQNYLSIQDPNNIDAYQRFNADAKLLEQDPFMLEEQRYLDRLKKSQIKQNLNYENMNQKYVIPQQQAQKNREVMEVEKAAERQEALKRFDETRRIAK